jgi:hypothetical protein
MVIRALDPPATLIKLSGYFALTYWCWYSYRCGLTTSMVTRMHVALALRLKLKLWETFIVIYRFMVWYLSWAAFREVLQDYVMEEKRIRRPQRVASFF